jgi:basic membrane protein A
VKKVLKLIFSLALMLTLAVALAACNNDDDNDGGTPATDNQAEVTTPDTTPPPSDESDDNNETTEQQAAPEADAVRIALIAHSPDSILDDGSFNQGAWDGIQRFLNTNNLGADHAMFFQPHSADDEARIDLVNDAVAWGADILVMPGFHFVASLYQAQDLFPDTRFILLDAIPAGDSGQRVEANVAAIEYAEQEAGFLAGYAAVNDGFRELGFMGGIAVPAVVRFGHGFIQGAEYAAAALGLDAGEVTISYLYLGGFAPTPEHQTTAAAWFATGTEIIFAAAGGATGSVIAGAEAQDGVVIGVDVDQSHLSEVVISSAMKALDNSVFDMITDVMNGSFRGGQVHMFNASINGIGLPMNNSRWNNFSQAQYDAIFAQLANGSIVVSPSLDMGDVLSNVSLVTVNEM